MRLCQSMIMSAYRESKTSIRHLRCSHEGARIELFTAVCTNYVEALLALPSHMVLYMDLLRMKSCP